jgi:2-desacetyl-2-hydroxyethyl bacteriochlorophyllide A dehydrogenase
MSEKMKAALWNGNGAMELTQIDRPPVGPDDALVRVRAEGICGSDLLIYFEKTDREAVPAGHEIAGEIVEVGGNVDPARIGERVAIEGIGHGRACLTCYYCSEGQYFLCENMAADTGGGYAEFVSRRAAGLYKLSDGMTWEEGALVEPLAVTLHAVRRGGLRGGETVAVLGSGTIGLCATAAARAMGAGTIVATARYPQQVEMAKQMGADIVVGSEGDELKDALAEISHGVGADLVVETVGGRSDAVMNQAVDVTRKQGRIVTTGNFHRPVKIDWMQAILNEISVVWSATYATSDGRNEFQIAIDEMGSGRVDLKPLVTHRVTLDEIQSGFETSFDKKTGAIKVQVLTA